MSTLAIDDLHDYALMEIFEYLTNYELVQSAAFSPGWADLASRVYKARLVVYGLIYGIGDDINTFSQIVRCFNNQIGKSCKSIKFHSNSWPNFQTFCQTIRTFNSKTFENVTEFWVIAAGAPWAVGFSLIDTMFEVAIDYHSKIERLYINVNWGDASLTLSDMYFLSDRRKIDDRVHKLSQGRKIREITIYYNPHRTQDTIIEEFEHVQHRYNYFIRFIPHDFS